MTGAADAWGLELLDRFAAAVSSTLPAEEGRTARALVFELISPREAEAVALRHLVPALSPLMGAWLQVHGSLEGVEEAGDRVDQRAAWAGVFEDMAALFTERSGWESS